MPKQNRRAKVDPIEQKIELVLNPGAFIVSLSIPDHRESKSFESF